MDKPYFIPVEVGEFDVSMQAFIRAVGTMMWHYELSLAVASKIRESVWRGGADLIHRLNNEKIVRNVLIIIFGTGFFMAIDVE